MRNANIGQSFVAVNSFVVVDGDSGNPTFNPRRRREIEMTASAPHLLDIAVYKQYIDLLVSLITNNLWTTFKLFEAI